MPTITFPRLRDDLGHAWGLERDAPQALWERFSDAYEARLETLCLLLAHNGFTIRLGGAGGQDGEYLVADHPDGRHLFFHLEDPHESADITATIATLRDGS